MDAEKESSVNTRVTPIVDDVFDIAAQSEVDMGSVDIRMITTELPRGTYAVGCRALNPVTKQLRDEAIELVEVQ